MIKLHFMFDVPDAEARRVCEIFGIDADSNPDGAARLREGLARAALEEYLLLATGERNPSTIRDLRELRLRLLARHLPDHLPSDEQISAFFQLTRAQARTLVSGTRARYRGELEELLRDAGRAALRAATKVGDDTVRIEASDSLAAFLAESVRVAAPPTKRTDASRKYDVGRSTVAELCAALGLAIEDVKALPQLRR